MYEHTRSYPQFFTVAISPEHRKRLEYIKNTREAKPCSECGATGPITYKSIAAEALDVGLAQLEHGAVERAIDGHKHEASE